MQIEIEQDQLTPEDEVFSRIRRFQERLKEKEIDGALILQT